MISMKSFPPFLTFPKFDCFNQMIRIILIVNWMEIV